MLDPTMFCQEFIDGLEHEILYIHDPDTTEAERIQASILDAKYCPADLAKITSECDQLDQAKQQHLLALHQNFEHLFDGTVGTGKQTQYTLTKT